MKGQSAVSGLLFFVMAVIIIALFMPVVTENIDRGLSDPAVQAGPHGSLLSLLLTFWPVYVGIILLVILVVIIRQ